MVHYHSIIVYFVQHHQLSAEPLLIASLANYNQKSASFSLNLCLVPNISLLDNDTIKNSLLVATGTAASTPMFS